MAEKTVYQQLAESVGAGGSTTIASIFEELAEDKEANLLLAAAPPATVKEISEKTSIVEKDIESMIEPLFKKGLLFKSKKPDATRYYRVRNLMQMHDATAVSHDAPPKMLELWKEYMATEWDNFRSNLTNVLPQPVMRVIPVNISFDSKAQVLALEDVKSIVDNAKSIAVTKCSCRAIDGKCGKPMDVCIQLDRAADYAIERGTGRELGKDETIRILKMCEEEGLVHMGGNNKASGHVICNCCDDCCMMWVPVSTGLMKFVAPSRFAAVVDAELCNGCESCLERCYFEAISMREADETAVVDPDKCMGCGLCTVVCPEDAINLNEVRPEEFIPA